MVGCSGAPDATKDKVGEEGEINKEDEEGESVKKGEEGIKGEEEDKVFDKTAAVVKEDEGAAATLDMVGGMGAGRR